MDENKLTEEKQHHDKAVKLAMTGAKDLFFPVSIAGSAFGGITKREYFAGLAMAGLMDPAAECALPTAELVAKSVETADALIAELAKGA